MKDRVDNGELEVKHEPTDMMWSDVLTKPKQGKPFRVFRSKLMDVPEEYDDEEERKRTHYMLLPNEPEVKQGICQQVVSNGSMSARVKPGKHRRSVLDGDKKSLQTVTWNTSQNKIDKKNPKLRERHLEPRDDGTDTSFSGFR